MWQTKRFLFLFFCLWTLTPIKCHSNQLKVFKHLAIKNEITSEWTGTTSKVYIGQKEYEIYTYQHESQNDRLFSDTTLSNLYTCINCEFAEWTRDKLFDLIEHLPLLYQSNFFYRHSNIFLTCHEPSISKKVNKVINYTTRFMNILFTYYKMYLNEHDTFIDTSFLSIVISLNFKIKYLNNLIKNPAEIEKIDKVVVRTVVGVLNSIQNYTLLNCKQSFYYENKQFFGFSMNESAEKDIKTFLKDIDSLQLEPIKSCNVLQMTLEEVFPNEIVMSIAWIINGDTLQLHMVIDRIKYITDFEVIYWYQKHMFNTVMKLLFTKTLDYLKINNNVPKNIINSIGTIYHDVLKDVESVPYDLHELFIILLSDTENVLTENSLFERKIIKYLNSLFYIHLQETSLTLEEFISYIQNTFDLECFIQLFDFLYYENNSYNETYFKKNLIKPLNNSIEQIFKLPSFDKLSLIKQTQIEMLEKEKQIDDNFVDPNGCHCFIGLYQYCFETLFYLNLALKTNYVLDTESCYYFEAISTVKDLSKLLSTLLYHSTNFFHYKVLYNILPLIELMEANIIGEYFDLKRLVHIIMTELNNYAIEFCSPPDYNILLFNNMDFDAIGFLSTRTHAEVQESILNLPKIERRYTRTYYSIRLLSSMFIKDSKFEKYNGIITIKWNGEKKSMSDIVHCIFNNVVSPRTIYSFYNICYKFCLSVIYYEVYNFYWEKKCNFGFRLLQGHDLKFPADFIELVSNINEFIWYYIDPQVTPQPTVQDIKIKIDTMFNKNGISIKLEELTSNRFGTVDSEPGAFGYPTLRQMNDALHEANTNLINTINFKEKVRELFKNNIAYGGITLPSIELVMYKNRIDYHGSDQYYSYNDNFEGGELDNDYSKNDGSDKHEPHRVDSNNKRSKKKKSKAKSLLYAAAGSAAGAASNSGGADYGGSNDCGE